MDSGDAAADEAGVEVGVGGLLQVEFGDGAAPDGLAVGAVFPFSADLEDKKLKR